jgi:hypothetical protein
MLQSLPGYFDEKAARPSECSPVIEKKTIEAPTMSRLRNLQGLGHVMAGPCNISAVYELLYSAFGALNTLSVAESWNIRVIANESQSGHPGFGMRAGRIFEDWSDIGRGQHPWPQRIGAPGN